MKANRLRYAKMATGFAGHCLPTDGEFMRDVRMVLKGSGFYLLVGAAGLESSTLRRKAGPSALCGKTCR